MGWKLFLILNRIKEIKRDYVLQLENASLDFDEICPKVIEYGLSSFDSSLYVRKNLDLKIIHLIPLRTIGLRNLYFWAEEWIETIPNNVRWLKWDENWFLYVIRLSLITWERFIRIWWNLTKICRVWFNTFLLLMVMVYLNKSRYLGRFRDFRKPSSLVSSMYINKVSPTYIFYTKDEKSWGQISCNVFFATRYVWGFRKTLVRGF